MKTHLIGVMALLLLVNVSVSLAQAITDAVYEPVVPIPTETLQVIELPPYVAIEGVIVEIPIMDVASDVAPLALDTILSPESVPEAPETPQEGIISDWDGEYPPAPEEGSEG